MLIEISVTLEPDTTLEDAQAIHEQILKSVNESLDHHDNKAIVGSSLTV